MSKITTRQFLSAYFGSLRLSKWIFAFAFIILVFLAYWSSSYVAAGAPYQVIAELRSVEPPHGGDALLTGYTFELADESSVTIYLPNNTPARIGDNAILEIQPMLLGGKSHRFMGYQDQAAN